MNINIYIEDQIAQQLSTYAKKLHIKRNFIVREAIKDWLKKHSDTKWPKSILEFEGIKDFPDTKELRKNLVEQDKKLF
jgi:predicted transcriptional regulator